MRPSRTLAIEGHGQADDGADPRGLGANTLRQMAAHYIAKHTSGLRSGAAVARRINKNVLPAIGDRALVDLHKRDINRVIDPLIEREAPVEAARVFEDMRAMFCLGRVSR